MVRITRISPGAAGKVFAYVSFLSGFVYTLVYVIARLAFTRGDTAEVERIVGIITLVLGPFLYALIGAITGFIGAWFYNITVKYTGGLAFETDEKRGFSSIDELP